MLTFGSLFSGIGGFDLGLTGAGMRCPWQVEKDESCRKLLAARFPNCERFDDVCTVSSAELIRPDWITGGFPCQDLSVAGRRAGLAGERSGLFFEFMRIVEQLAPDGVLIENVPGLLSSNGGRDMGTVLGFLAKLGYGTAYRILDAQWFGLAQRRKRVFIVGCLGNWRSAAEILFERESLPWDSPPSREAGTGVAGRVAGCLNSGGNNGGFRTEPGEHLIASLLTMREGCDGVLPFDERNVTSRENRSNPNWGDECHTLHSDPPRIAGYLSPRACRNSDTCNEVGIKDGEIHDTLQSDGPERTCEGTPLVESQEELAYAMTNPGAGGRSQCRMLMDQRMAVRRLTPRECERLHGFPDDWTAGFSDSARYRMLGNSIAVPVARWIAERIVS